MTNLTCWMYISTAAIPRAEATQAIDTIVAVSRIRNQSLDVTGALIFSGDIFAQIIEGPAKAVAELRASISRDTRHEDIRTVAVGEQISRAFLGWSLAYSGASRFVARELGRIRGASLAEPHNASHDLRRLLGELAS